MSNQAQFSFLADLDILPEWEATANRFVEAGGTVMVLGAPDTGKSTLCRYLVYRVYAAGHQVALVDLDLGQTHLGPPATLGLGLFPPRLPGYEGVTAEAIDFIGQTSPVGNFLEVAVGCRVLVDQAHFRGYHWLVVNTSGLVQGTGALILKRAQMELLQPALILGLQRDRELEPLLKGLAGETTSIFPDTGDFRSIPKAGSRRPEAGLARGTVLRLPVSKQAIRRGPEERRSYRESRFRRYFQRAKRLDLAWRRLVWEGQPWGHGDPLDPEILEYFHRKLGVVPLYGESQGRRAVLLLPEAPEGHNQENSWKGHHWDKVHWLTWPSLHWRLVGLLDGRHRTLALGLVLPRAWDQEILALWSPFAQAASQEVRFLKVGKLRLNLHGQELSHV